MKILLLLPFVFILGVPQQTGPQEISPVQVVSFKWSHSRKTIDKADNSVVAAPASAMIPQNKNFSRNARGNDPAGVRDPNADTLDGRSAAIEKSVQDARAPQSKQVEGYSYKIKVQNTAPNAIEVLFWEYQAADPNDANSLTRRQFLCGVNIRSGNRQDLEGFSLQGPINVISVASANSANAPQEKILINRVEFADGTIWQRKDWNLKDVKATYERALKEPWVPGMCKGL